MELCPKDLYSLFESRLLHNLDPNSEYSSFAQRSISLTSNSTVVTKFCCCSMHVGPIRRSCNGRLWMLPAQIRTICAFFEPDYGYLQIPLHLHVVRDCVRFIPVSFSLNGTKECCEQGKKTSYHIALLKRTVSSSSKILNMTSGAFGSFLPCVWGFNALFFLVSHCIVVYMSEAPVVML